MESPTKNVITLVLVVTVAGQVLLPGGFGYVFIFNLTWGHDLV